MNVIVICLDTFRADIIGESGKLNFVQTPNLDDFAAQSVTFTRAFGECQPTLQMRRSIFTGMRSFPWRWNFDRRGHWPHAPGWHKIPPEHDTLAEILLSHGYMTGLVSDTYHMFKPTMNYTRGFVTYEFIRGQEDDNWRGGTYELIIDQFSRYVRDPENYNKYPRIMQYLLNTYSRMGEEDYFCAKVFKKAGDWLVYNHLNSPFFLWVDGFDPHEPWDPPKVYADKYAPGYKGLEFIYPSKVEPRSSEENKRAKAAYFGEVTFVDKWIGYLFEQIDTLKLWNNTLVIITSDHGTQVYDHGRFGKDPKFLYSYNTQINCLMRHPRGPCGERVDGFIQAHDITATILFLLEIEHPTEGLNMWPLVTGEVDSIRDHVVIGWADHFTNGAARGYASVRDDEWNYIVAIGKEDNDPRLYNLSDDPEEQNNVATNHPKIIERQRRRIETVLGSSITTKQIEVSDTMLSPRAKYMKNRTAENDCAI